MMGGANSSTEKCGLQVVKVDGDLSYRLDEELLGRVLLRDDVRERPVAVISVAGAYRGGKSFLLDFFLRYLHAPAESQKNGQWIGSDVEALCGFEWRPGSEPDTTGIVIWSEPILVELLSGEKIAVILIDTQGIFDQRITMRDCSTIFGLTTLLSSVQIYNLKEDIKEDHLQHLQLFTEYGKLTSTDKFFQDLKFLIRDWSYPYEYPYGADGGNRLLKKRLEIKEDQPDELKEIRRYIYSCFTSVDCFLMPHPGHLVSSKKDFNGCIAEINDDFKQSLLEFVPSLLGSQNLKPKLINGQPVTGEQLFYFFKSYIGEFNSDAMPSSLNIMKATSEVSVLMAMQKARERYTAQMSDVTLHVMTSTTLKRRDAVARHDACSLLTSGRFMGSVDVSSRSAQIDQGLTENFALYLKINKERLRPILAECKSIYERTLLKDSSEERICLHPKDLMDDHHEAVREAMTTFDSKILTTPDEEEEDEDRAQMLQSFEERFKAVNEANENRNREAVRAGRELYSREMRGACGAAPCVPARRVPREHVRAALLATCALLDLRTRRTQHPTDPHVTQLDQDIDKVYGKIQKQNEINNGAAVTAALGMYDECIAMFCGPLPPCLHSIDLRIRHDRGSDQALRRFYSFRVSPRDDLEEDEHRQSLDQAINERFVALEIANEESNRRAIDAAKEVYCQAMLAVCGPGQKRLIGLTLSYKHRNAQKLAEKRFTDSRSVQSSHPHDPHFDRLKQIITEKLRYYRAVNSGKPVPVEHVVVPAVVASVVAVGAAIATGGMSMVATAATATTGEAVGATLVTAVATAATAAGGFVARILGR